MNVRGAGAALCLLAISLPGCAVISIDGNAKATIVKFGVLRVEPASTAGAITYRARGIGIVPSHNGVTIGASDETAMFVFAPDACRIVLFNPKREDLDALLKVIAAASATPDTICIRGTKP